VPPSRLGGWCARFGERHGGVVTTELAATSVRVTAADGATATCAVPFGPLSTVGAFGAVDGLAIEPLVAHLERSRRVGLVLVRLGGHSVGVALDGRIVLSRTGNRLVHGRSAAGGWSQRRFARRRAGQAREALRSAADDVVDVLVPAASTLDAVVLGGDRAALAELRADVRLAKVFALAEPRVLDVPEPRRAVLDDAAARVLAVEIVVRDP
jgi:VLRF1 release factor-like protein